MESVVLLFPHPDDDAYGMGGTVLRMKGKYKLHSLCLTRGERGLGPVASAETAATREREERACASLLGSELEFMGEIDAELFAGREICERVAARLKAISPRAILTTFPMEHHPDHRAAAQIAVAAAKLAGIYDSVEIYQAEEGAGDQTISFDPQLYVDIGEVLEAKTALIRCHACQNEDDHLVARAMEQSRFRGRLAGCEHAEAWRTYFPLVNAGSRRGRVPLLLQI
jgi:N-acetylglucosamine malate deacetylase 2